MNISDIQAIIPVGFNTFGDAGNNDDELFVADGISLLCRALGEVAGAGISKALIAVAYSDVLPRWVSSAVQECQRNLEAFQLPLLQIEILYLGGCSRLDDGVAFAMSCLTTPWAAVICPLAHQPDMTGLSLIAEAALALNKPVIGIAQTNWATAIQLCTLALSDNHLACAVEPYCLRDDQPMVYAGRAILPTTPLPSESFSAAWDSENAALISHFIATTGPLHTCKLEGHVSDFRFQCERTASQITHSLKAVDAGAIRQ